MVVPTQLTPKCNDDGEWKVTLDLVPLAATVDRIQFQVTHQGDTICDDVLVAYEGPGENYVSVSAGDSEGDSFYVMKYEAKVEDRNSITPVSKPEGKPLYGVSYAKANRLCENLGTQYELMTNSQWQKLAWPN